MRDDDALLRAIIEGITDPIFVKDRQRRYVLINAAGAALVGRSEGEVVGLDDAALFPREAARRIAADDREVLESGEPLHKEETLVVGGETKSFLTTKVAYFDAQGRPAGLIGIARDITGRVRAEEALRESEERLASIVESAMDAVVSIDDKGIVRLFNAAAEDVFRCSAADALGRPVDRFISPEIRDLLSRCQRAFGRSGTRRRYVWAPEGLTAVRADGERFPVEAAVTAAEVAGERLYTLILRDSSERRPAEG